MNRAVPIPIGTAMTMARIDVHSVPKIRTEIPQDGGSASGSHCWFVSSDPVLFCKAGIDFQTRNAAMAASTTRTVIPAPVVRKRKLRSPGLTDRSDVIPG